MEHLSTMINGDRISAPHIAYVKINQYFCPEMYQLYTLKQQPILQ